MNNQPPEVRDGFQVRYTLLVLAGPLFIQLYDIFAPPEEPILWILMGAILIYYYLALTLFLILAIAVNLYRPRPKIILSLLLPLVLTSGYIWAAFHGGIIRFTSD